MKIYQDNNETVVVQFKDLVRLNDKDKYIPDSIKEKIKENLEKTTSKEEYIKFTKTEEIEFFKTIDWIVDYRELGDMTIDELNIEIKKTMGYMSLLSEKYIRTKDYDLIERYSDMEYKFKTQEKILSDKVRKKGRQKVKRAY